MTIWLPRTLLLLAASLTSPLFAQKDVPAEAQSAKKPEIPSRVIDLSHAEPLTGLPDNSVLSYASVCSSRGVIYSTMRAVTPAGSPVQLAEVYAADEQRNVAKWDLSFPDGFKQAGIRQFYPSEHRLAALLQATQPVDPSVVLAAGQSVAFLSALDLDTGETTVVPVDPSFQVAKAAIFESGKFLALGVGADSPTPELAILREDGTVQQTLDLDPTDFPVRSFVRRSPSGSDETAAAESPQAAAATAQRQALRALSGAQFAPWGDAVLLVQPGRTPHIYKVRDSGEHDRLQIALPEGASMLRVLGSGEKDSWVVAARTGSAEPNFQRRGTFGNSDPASNVFYEVDPFTGSIIDRLTPTGPLASQVMCAADRRLAAIYLGATDEASGQQVLGYASAPR